MRQSKPKDVTHLYSREWSKTNKNRIDVYDFAGQKINLNLTKVIRVPVMEEVEDNVKPVKYRWEVISPNGEVFYVNNLRKFCRESEINLVQIANKLYKNDMSPVTKGLSKGWSIRYKT